MSVISSAELCCPIYPNQPNHKKLLYIIAYLPISVVLAERYFSTLRRY